MPFEIPLIESLNPNKLNNGRHAISIDCLILNEWSDLQASITMHQLVTLVLCVLCLCLTQNSATTVHVVAKTRSSSALYHHKYLHARINYYTNSSASFQTELLKCGDINPNPGPENGKRVYRYSVSELYELRSRSNGAKIPSSTWKEIQNLNISSHPITHRGKRGGRRKLHPMLHVDKPTYQIHEPCNRNLNLNQNSQGYSSNKIPVIIRPRSKRHSLIASDRSNLRNLVRVPRQQSRDYDLPKVLLTNLRALSNKLEDLEIVARNNQVDVIAISETWLKQDTPP